VTGKRKEHASVVAATAAVQAVAHSCARRHPVTLKQNRPLIASAAAQHDDQINE
jgi:hypothetical protein